MEDMKEVPMDKEMPAESASQEYILPKSAFGDKDLKPGEMLKVTKVDGDNVSVECVDEAADEPMDPEAMNKMSNDEAMKMPMDKLESKLPKYGE